MKSIIDAIGTMRFKTIYKPGQVHLRFRFYFLPYVLSADISITSRRLFSCEKAAAGTNKIRATTDEVFHLKPSKLQ